MDFVFRSKRNSSITFLSQSDMYHLCQSISYRYTSCSLRPLLPPPTHQWDRCHLITRTDHKRQTNKEFLTYVCCRNRFCVFVCGCAQQPLKKQDVSANCVDFFPWLVAKNNTIARVFKSQTQPN